MAGKVVNTSHVAHREDCDENGTMFLRDGLVYVARFQFWGKGRHFRGSPFKNPYSVKAYGLDEALRLYERHLGNSPELLAKLPELEGKTLACWCAGKDGAPDVLTAEDPVVCHGQIILKLIEEMQGKPNSNVLPRAKAA